MCVWEPTRAICLQKGQRWVRSVSVPLKSLLTSSLTFTHCLQVSISAQKKKNQPLFWTPVGETAQSYYKVKQRKGSACRLAQVIDDQTKANRNPTWAQTAHVGLWDAIKKIKTIFNGGNRINCTIFQTLSIFTEYCQTIFPLILPPPPLIFPVIPCPSLSALLCPHQDGTQKVQWGSLIRNFHGWLKPAFHRPSLDISLGKNSSRRYDWGGSNRGTRGQTFRRWKWSNARSETQHLRPSLCIFAFKTF